ncbi:hypothetical protein [Dokdonella sp.]|uniref:hypothetical protein n=1 Tax=Dokdonella sp. TaxID=2291710 RepID=UPI001B21ED3A|nr:hypothetical protein [Dokdonella sp.]MBO9664682.1 hypothetical protein [Dokdonella sp.]
MTSSGSGQDSREPSADAAAVVSDLLEESPPPGEFERLRELLLGEERRALDAARARIAELERTQDNLSQRLPGALEALADEASTTRVANALAAPVSQALGAAVQRNRQSLIDVLFPIIGPLIRKSIAEALRNLVADLNGAIESSFTLRGLKWRVEAWRAGVPYAQVVLKHRLAYAIDHVFLIERDSGLVLHHEAAPGLPELDKDAIAGMLTALGDFVGDSVGREGGGTLESVRVGEHLVWMLHGPRANLACFIRGVPPQALHGLLEQRLEEIHARLAAAADEDPRTPQNQTIWHEALQPPALIQEAGRSAESEQRKSPSRWPLLLIVLVLAALLFAFLLSRERWQARVDDLRGKLEAHPGFVLNGIEAKPWSRLVVHGLLDPDAAPLAPLLDASAFGGVEPKLDATGYLSTDDAVVERRAQRLLQPPAGVRIAVKDGALNLSGAAPQAWLDTATERAGWIAGVARVASTLTPEIDPVATARAELQRLVREFPSTQVGFLDDATPADDAANAVDTIAREARRAIELAKIGKVRVRLTCVGANTEVGSGQTNQRLRAARAQWLALALAARGVGGTDGGALATDGDAGLNRRVAYLRLTVEDTP